MMGKVYLVGAGPGDAGLLTIRGCSLLKQADTVVYDALVGDGILSLISPQAKQINVGKRSSHHLKQQEEIHTLLAEEAKKGRMVVRLKGGDPFLFGRGGEELAFLKQQGISCEVVPGVSSALAVPAYSGIPVTCRGISSSVHIFTGHKREGRKEKPLFDYEKLAKLEGTLIFMMGAASAQEICTGLLDAGMKKEMPAAFLQSGTTAEQRTVCVALECIVSEAEKKGLKAPAILAVGEACGLAAKLLWAEKRPLHGKRVLITRPRTRSGELAALLREQGAEVLELPAIETVRFLRTPEIDKVFQNFSEYRWLVFTSPAGAEAFFEELSERRMDVRSLSEKKIAVIGPATGACFLKRGVLPDYMPERYYGMELGAGLVRQTMQGEKLLLLRAQQGGKALLDVLTEAGLSCTDLSLYHTEVPAQNAMTERVKERLKAQQIDFITFTSASTVRGFLTQLQPSEEECSSFTAVCIGTETEKEARLAGMRTVTAAVPSMKSMADAVLTETFKTAQAFSQYLPEADC